MVFYTICFLLYTSYYGTLFQTYRTFVYLFCVLVYTRGTAPSCPGGLLALTKPSLLLIKSANNGDGGQSLIIEMLTYVSLLFNWAQFVKICISNGLFSSNCPCPLRKPRTLLHKFDVSLVRSHREDDAKTENIFIFAAASESKKLDTTKSHAELPKVPKTDYILMFRFWPNFPNSGWRGGRG